MPKDRAYDPKRRPNTFYKGDRASDNELASRARSRGQTMAKDKVSSIADYVSDMVGFDMAEGGDSVSTKVTNGGKRLENIHAQDGQGNTVSRAASTNMPISGTRLGKTKSMMEGRPQA
jgi:hypothetical protein